MKKYIALISLFGFLSAPVVFAISRPYEGSVDIEEVLNNVVNWLFTIFLVIAVLFIILAAFQFLTAGGDSTKVSGARDKLLYAAIGIAVAILSKAIVPLVQTILGV